MHLFNWFIGVFFFFTVLPFRDFGRVEALGCGGYIDMSVTKSGMLTSPNYPDIYPNYTFCVWNLEASPRHRINLDIDIFGGQSLEGRCLDYIEVRDGHKDATPVLQKTCSPLRDVRLMSTARWLRVEFKSDGQFAGSGLKAFYSERLGGDELDRNRFPLDGCLSFEFECGNAECLSRSYVCDGFNDCGCEGNCDEDNCEKTQIGQLAASLIGIIIGVGIFTTLFALAYSQENKLRKRAQGL